MPFVSNFTEYDLSILLQPNSVTPFDTEGYNLAEEIRRYEEQVGNGYFSQNPFASPGITAPTTTTPTPTPTPHVWGVPQGPPIPGPKTDFGPPPPIPGPKTDFDPPPPVPGPPTPPPVFNNLGAAIAQGVTTFNSGLLGLRLVALLKTTPVIAAPIIQIRNLSSIVSSWRSAGGGSLGTQTILTPEDKILVNLLNDELKQKFSPTQLIDLSSELDSGSSPATNAAIKNWGSEASSTLDLRSSNASMSGPTSSNNLARRQEIIKLDDSNPFKKPLLNQLDELDRIDDGAPNFGSRASSNSFKSVDLRSSTTSSFGSEASLLKNASSLKEEALSAVKRIAGKTLQGLGKALGPLAIAVGFGLFGADLAERLAKNPNEPATITVLKTLFDNVFPVPIFSIIADVADQKERVKNIVDGMREANEYGRAYAIRNGGTFIPGRAVPQGYSDVNGAVWGWDYKDPVYLPTTVPQTHIPGFDLSKSQTVQTFSGNAYTGAFAPDTLAAAQQQRQQETAKTLSAGILSGVNKLFK